jgi:hypothetical protein
MRSSRLPQVNRVRLHQARGDAGGRVCDVTEAAVAPCGRNERLDRPFSLPQIPESNEIARWKQPSRVG